MDNQQGLASLGGVPVQYIGRKARKTDNVASTGLEWTPGQIHIVPPLVAQKLTRFADIWREADQDAVNEDPSKVGIIIGDPAALANSRADEGGQGLATGQQPPAGQQQDEQPQTFDLPNLQGMTKADLATYSASQFNHQLDGGMKKEDMIQAIVTLANSRAGEGVGN
ncbi:MAG: hypothetical protein J0I30_11285 [Burkholderiales bacterium]|nr:hypothetical protein [Burkholderiales bacterium]